MTILIVLLVNACNADGVVLALRVVLVQRARVPVLVTVMMRMAVVVLVLALLVVAR